MTIEVSLQRIRFLQTVVLGERQGQESGHASENTADPIATAPEGLRHYPETLGIIGCSIFLQP